jgi:hypothetical protein
MRIPTETELHAFVAAHLPELAADQAWTPDQQFAIFELHQTFTENGGHWRCACGGCETPVDRLADVCAAHRDEDDEPIVITWEAIGVEA